MTAPGTFSNKQSPTPNDGVRRPQTHHLVLTAANGEPVVTSETHPTPEGSKESLEVVVRTVLDAAHNALTPEWTVADLYSDEAARRVTDYLWDQQ